MYSVDAAGKRLNESIMESSNHMDKMFDLRSSVLILLSLHSRISRSVASHSPLLSRKKSPPSRLTSLCQIRRVFKSPKLLTPKSPCSHSSTPCFLLLPSLLIPITLCLISKTPLLSYLCLPITLCMILPLLLPIPPALHS